MQTELSSKFSISTNTYPELVKAIKDRLEMKNPAKNRVLHFLNTTKQRQDQSLCEYIHSAHRVAQESGLHDGKWNTHDLETLIIISGMRDEKQNFDLLVRYEGKEKITHQDLILFGNTRESIDNKKKQEIR